MLLRAALTAAVYPLAVLAARTVLGARRPRLREPAEGRGRRAAA